MACPVKPDDFKALRVTGGERICDAFNKALIRQPDLLYQFINWMFRADGTLSDAILALIKGGNNPDATYAPLIPITISASSGKPGYIQLTWDMPSGSAPVSYFKVYRWEDDDVESAVHISNPDPTSRSYTDAYSTGNTITEGVTYYYWVEAVNAAGASPKNTQAVTGSFVTAGTDTAELEIGDKDVTFNANGFLDIYVWGGGGGGGNGKGPAVSMAWADAFAAKPPSYSGGGGGAGGATKVTVTLTSGDRYKFVVGNGGAATIAGQDSYVLKYGTSTWNTTRTAEAKGGSAGGSEGQGGGRGGIGIGANAVAGGNGGDGQYHASQTMNGGAGGIPAIIAYNTVDESHGAGGAGGPGSANGAGVAGSNGYIRYVYRAT